MNSRSRERGTLPKWLALPVVILVIATASAQNKPNAPAPPNKPAPAPQRPAAAQRPAPAQHPAQAQHPAPAQHPAAQAQHPAPAQHPGGNAQAARQPAAKTAQRPVMPAANAANRAPSGNTTNRGTGGGPAQAYAPAGQMNRTGQAGNNLANHAGAARPGATGNHGGQAGNTAASRTAAGNHPASAGSNAESRQTGPPRNVSLKGGGTATVRGNGQVRSISRNGMQIQHGLRGGRTVVGTHNGARVVNTGKNSGYVQKQYATKNGHSYYSRTSCNNGNCKTSAYQGYNYNGQTYYGYTPTTQYQPSFYGWAEGSSGVGFSFDASAAGWSGSSWSGYYGFTPYSSYPGPAYWLTDYLIAADLQAAYAARLAYASMSVAGVPVSVIASQPWNDTGVQVVPGETYVITATGVANFASGNPNTNVSPAGDGRPACFADPQPIAPGLPCMSLVGKIGPVGTPFYVGPGLRLVAPTGGELFLGMNDNIFGDNLGAWAATINPAGAGEAPTSAAQTLPPVLSECENGICGTWTWDGTQYNAQWVQGSVATLSVVKWDGSTLVLNRVDSVGASAGATSTFTGTVVGPNTITGTEVGSWPGHFNWNVAWTATSPTPILPPVAPPVEAAATSGPDPISITPEVKQAVAQEVKAQIEAEQASVQTGGQVVLASSKTTVGGELPPALDPARRTFIVHIDLSVTSNGQECGLSGGDVIMRMTDTPDAENDVNASVSASKKSDCSPGQMVAVKVEDLQEMQNHFAEQTDSGLAELAKKSGKGGIPKAPDTRTVASDVPPPPPDPNAEKTLDDQRRVADQTEAQVNQEVGGPGGGARR